MGEDEIWGVDAAASYDTPGTGMFAADVVGPTVERLAKLAGNGAALEFAVGTGRVAIPLWVPELRKLPMGQTAIVCRNEPGYIAVDTYDVLRQAVVSHHFWFDEHGQTRLFRTPQRYIWPAELDLMASLAGFELESRHADWDGGEFEAQSRSHVSVYRLSAP